MHMSQAGVAFLMDSTRPGPKYPSCSAASTSEVAASGRRGWISPSKTLEFNGALWHVSENGLSYSQLWGLCRKAVGVKDSGASAFVWSFSPYLICS